MLFPSHTPNHAPTVKNYDRSLHICQSLDALFNRYTNTDDIPKGDFSSIEGHSITQHYHIHQIVDKLTRGNHISDKVYTNMVDRYLSARILPPIATFDHQPMLLQPQTDMKRYTQTSGICRNQINENKWGKYARSNLINPNWTPLYRFESCASMF